MGFYRCAGSIKGGYVDLRLVLTRAGLATSRAASQFWLVKWLVDRLEHAFQGI